MTDIRPRGPVIMKVPEGDDRPRKMCEDCGFINYENPKIIVGAVCTWQEPGEPLRYLLCRRAIEPRMGFWTMPAGFMELGETTEAGAAREVWEEARAEISVDSLLGLYSLPRINQVHLIYRASMLQPSHESGPESLETVLFEWDEIPWDELAFPTVHWSLEAHRQCLSRDTFAPFGVPDGWAAEKSFK